MSINYNYNIYNTYKKLNFLKIINKKDCFYIFGII